MKQQKRSDRKKYRNQEEDLLFVIKKARARVIEKWERAADIKECRLDTDSVPLWCVNYL